MDNQNSTKSLMDEERLNNLYYEANVWNCLNSDEFYNTKHFRVKIYEYIENNEENDEDDKEVEVGEFFCRLYDVENSEYDASTLLDIDHGDSVDTALITAKKFNLDLDDESLIVYFEDIYINEQYKNMGIESHVISNISEIIYSLIFRRPSLVIMCATDKEYEYISDINMDSDDIYIAGIGKAARGGNLTYCVLYSSELNFRNM